jgi:tetratricopeptide (TPR) repeat protein
MSAERSNERWRKIVANQARGETATTHDVAYRAAYEVAHPEEAASQTPLWTELGALSEHRHAGERSDEDIVAGALALLDAPAGAIPSLSDDVGEPHQAAPAVWPVVLAVSAVVLSVAAGMVLWFVGGDAMLPGQRGRDHSLTPAWADTAEDGGEATLRSDRPRRARAHRPRASTKAVEEVIILEDDAGRVAPEEPPPVKKKTLPRATQPRTASAMLEHAQELFAGGKIEQALEVYLKLLQEHPRSAEAKVARVSVGRIELRRGNSRKALRHFDDYLAASAGTLQEEARYGRIRALRQLERTEQERRSIEAFLADHPKSIYAPRLQRRLQELAP